MRSTYRVETAVVERSLAVESSRGVCESSVRDVEGASKKMKRITTLLSVATAMVLITGCGAEATDGHVPDDQTGVTEPVDQESIQPEVTSKQTDESSAEDESPTHLQGAVVIDGVSYDINSVRACDPYNEGPIERELELQGTGEYEGTRTQIDVYVQTIGGAPMDEVSWAGPEGIYGGPENADVTVDGAGSRVFGEATLRDAMTQEETVHIEFELQIPAETVACR